MSYTVLTEENVTTHSEGRMSCGNFSYSQLIDVNSLIITFDGTEYEVNKVNFSNSHWYGGISQTGPDFSEYPFVVMSSTNGNLLCTSQEGTYSVKIEVFVEDSDSSTEFSPVITHLMTSPSNTNWNVLSSMLGDGDWSELKTYVETTPHNMNRMVLESLLSGGNSDVEEWVAIFDGSITTRSSGNFIMGSFVPTASIKGDSVLVTFENVTYELPKAFLSFSTGYGEFDNSNAPILTNYPCAIGISSSTSGDTYYFFTSEANTYEVKIEILENSSAG